MKPSSVLDTEWLRDALVRLNIRGPRYTSYPTAPQWADVDETKAVQVARDQASDSETPLSVYAHIPFCERRCLFCGCNVIVRPHRESVGEDYLQWFDRELVLRALQFESSRKLVQFHIGGGTPTFLTPVQLERVAKSILERFDVQPGMEFSMEIDPCEVRPEHIERLRALGLNRVSLGVQDFDDNVQSLVKRFQTEEDTRRTIEWARQAGLRFINVDLIYGLPGQTVETFSRSIERLLDMGATRLAIYSYAHVPWIRPHQKRIDEKLLPDPATKLQVYLTAWKKLTEAGFVAIGMDHFALPEDELTLAQRAGTLHRNFMGYTTRAGTDLLGLGASAISFSNRRFTQNHKELSEYTARLEQGRIPLEKACVLSTDDHIRGDLIAELMCNFSVKLPAFGKRHGIDFFAYFSREIPALKPLEQEGLLTLDAHGLHVTERGRFFVRNICMVFDAYLNRPSQEGGPLYSATV